RGGAPLRERARGRTRAAVRPRRAGVATLRGAGVHRSVTIRHRRSGSSGGSTLPGSGAVRTARVRPFGSMIRLALSLASALLILVLTVLTAPAQAPPVAPEVLPNGLTAFVRGNDAAPGRADSVQVPAAR